MRDTNRMVGERARLGLVGLIGLLLVATAQVGCASSSRRAQTQQSVLRAENIDLRQQNDALGLAANEARSDADRALADARAQKARLAAAQAEIEQGQMARMALDDHRAATQRMNQEMAVLDQEIERLQKLIAAMPDPAPPYQEPDLRRGSAPHLDAFARDLEMQLARYDVSGLKVEKRGQRVAIVMQDAFDPGKATLADRPEAVRAVVNLGRLIDSTYPNSRVYVEGHTDSDPIKVHTEWSSNEHLSQARADAVRKLLAGAGVPVTEIETTGMGAAQPLVPNRDKTSKARNRRVEIYIAPGA